MFDDPNEPGNKVPGRLVNVVFPGIREQLLKLRADGYYLALASCKPEYQCVPICEHFHLTELLDGIYGASGITLVWTKRSGDSVLLRQNLVRCCSGGQKP